MEANEYQKQAQQYAVFPLDDSGWDYILSALPEELGEFSSIFAKAARKGHGRSLSPEELKLAKAELGDLCWGIALAAKLLGTDLNTIMNNNLNKLEGRKARGVIEGSGDTR